MVQNSKKRSLSDIDRIELLLNQSHAHMGRAGFLVISMLVKKTLWRAYLSDAIRHLEASLESLKEVEKVRRQLNNPAN